MLDFRLDFRKRHPLNSYFRHQITIVKCDVTAIQGICLSLILNAFEKLTNAMDHFF